MTYRTTPEERKRRAGVMAEVRKKRWPQIPLKERFNLLWCAEPFSGCWLWQKSCINMGYGQISVDGKKVLAHRLAWELYRGAIPEGPMRTPPL